MGVLEDPSEIADPCSVGPVHCSRSEIKMTRGIKKLNIVSALRSMQTCKDGSTHLAL